MRHGRRMFALAHLLVDFVVEARRDLVRENELKVHEENKKTEAVGQMIPSVLCDVIIMIISTIANSTALYNILKRNRAEANSLHIMMYHIFGANLMSTLLLMPVKIIWNLNLPWTFGIIPGRLLTALGTFSLYLSGFLVMALSVDRYLTLFYPVSARKAIRRAGKLITGAWVSSIVLCNLLQVSNDELDGFPMLILWSTELINSQSDGWEVLALAYNYFGFALMFALPICVIVSCHLLVGWKIRKMKATLGTSLDGNVAAVKDRVLNITILVGLGYFLCWAPFYGVTFLFMIQNWTKLEFYEQLQSGALSFGLLNFCIAPLVYIIYGINMPEQERDHEISITKNIGLFHSRSTLMSSVVVNNEQNGPRAESRANITVHDSPKSNSSISEFFDDAIDTMSVCGSKSLEDLRRPSKLMRLSQRQFRRHVPHWHPGMPICLNQIPQICGNPIHSEPLNIPQRAQPNIVDFVSPTEGRVIQNIDYMSLPTGRHQL